MYEDEHGENAVPFYDSAEERVMLLHALGNHYIHLESSLGEDTIVLTNEHRLLLTDTILDLKRIHGATEISNLREIVSAILDDNEFKVFMVKHEG